MLKEEIGRNYHTPDTDPIQWDHHEDLDVQYYGNDGGTWSVQISCTKPGYEHLSTGLHKFPDEPSADYFARQQGDRIIRTIMNEGKLRSIIKSIISEATGFGCNNHSLGFINSDGKFIDLQSMGMDHDDYLWDVWAAENKIQHVGIPECPPGWIKVSNANEFWLEADPESNISDWTMLPTHMFDGLVEVWITCVEWSNWIKNDFESHYVTVGIMSDSEVSNMQEFTAPEILERWGTDTQMDRLFSGLMSQT